MLYQVYESLVIILWILSGIQATVLEDKLGKYSIDTHVFSSYRDTPMNESILPYTSNYTTLLFLKDGKLVVGARNYIVSLNVTDQEFSLLKVKSWIPDASMSQTTCISSDSSKENCYNFIKVLSEINDKLLCCGTNSYYPECSWRNITSLEEISESFYGKGLVPFLPNSKSTYAFSDDGRFFSGVETEFGGYGKTVLATDFDQEDEVSKVLKVFKNEFFLDDPVFHRGFLIGDYFYFFFDEVARECVNCDPVRYSRVGRLCKKDDGGSGSFFWNNFLTFQKARLNCSAGGIYSFNYNILRDIYWDKERQTFYGVFTTERSYSLHTSAVCSYNLKEIESAFSGTFNIKELKKNVWTDKQNPGHIKECIVNVSPSKRKFSTFISGRIHGSLLSRSALIEHHNFVLASNVVQPRFNVTSFNMRNIRFLKVLTVTFELNPGQITEVWYVATDRGTILKLSKIRSSLERLCIFKEYSIFQDGKPERLLEMKLSPNKEFIVIGSDSKVTKLYLIQCDIHQNKRNCLEAQDPLCGWSTKQGRCIPWNKRDVQDWQQDIKSCPQRNAQWSEWSSWDTCEQTNGNLCRCRRRKCVFIRDENECNGSDIQLKNCTVTQLTSKGKKAWIQEGVVHGKWSPWSEWSICYRGFRNRSRTCNEPAAKNGGMKCRENSKDYVLCEPEKYDGNVTYLWTSWNRVRGPERKVRRYKLSCTSKAVVMKSLQIDVEDTETKNCTKELCIDPVMKPQHVLTAWSDWLSCNSTIDKVRTRHMCGIDNLNDTWSCKQQDIERNYTSVTLSVPACVPSSTSTTTTTTDSSKLQSTACGAVTDSVDKSETTKTLTNNFGHNVSSVKIHKRTEYSSSLTSTKSTNSTTTIGKAATVSASNLGSSSTVSKATDIKPTRTTEAVCVTTVISTIVAQQISVTERTTQSAETDITKEPPSFQWSSCACDHEVALSNVVLGIQHRSRIVDKVLVNEYRTCVCEVGNTVTTDNPNLADMEALEKGEEDRKFSLKMLITIVSVCCVICIIVTAIILVIYYHKYPPSRKKDNNNKSNGTPSDHREISQGV